MSDRTKVAEAIDTSIAENRIVRVTVRDIWDAEADIMSIRKGEFESVDTGLDSLEVWSTEGLEWRIELVQEGGRAAA